MNDSVVDKLDELKNKYYETHKKNTFFKNSQKQELANMILTQVSMEDLLHRTTYIIENTNCVYIDYTVLKTYINDNTYEITVKYMCDLFKQCIENYGNYECHLNLLSLTVSACERNKGIFNYIFIECHKSNDIYTTLLKTFYIYNTPSTMSNIIKLLTPLMSPLVKQKIKLFDKIESPALIQSLHQNI
jgi:hypothetical protein